MRRSSLMMVHLAAKICVPGVIDAPPVEVVESGPSARTGRSARSGSGTSLRTSCRQSPDDAAARDELLRRRISPCGPRGAPKLAIRG